MKRAFSIAVLIAALAAGASVAEAKIASGSFKGKTEAKDPVAFKITSTGRVQSFYFESVHLKCTDGDEFDTFSGPGQRIETPKNTTFRVSKARRFHIKSRSKNGSGWDAYGTFNRAGSKAAGTIHVFAQFNNRNEQDPKGSIHCESDKLAYTVSRK